MAPEGNVATGGGLIQPGRQRIEQLHEPAGSSAAAASVTARTWDWSWPGSVGTQFGRCAAARQGAGKQDGAGQEARSC